MPIKVFISHKNSDAVLAERVNRRIRGNGIETYLDIIDDALEKDGPDLADHLLGRMGECQQLVAVVSSSTKNSWWVPWEIGVGSEKGFLMASFSYSYVQLPSYLEKWPALHSDRDIDLYCQYSKRTDAEIGRRSWLTEQQELSFRKNKALNFHKRLRTALG